VTGGFARSVVNFNAGANTPLAGILSAVWVAVILLFFTQAFYFLPNSVLAATIIVAVAGLIDWQKIRSTWQYDKGDFLSLIGTLLMVLVVGVEAGIIAGVVISLVVLVWRSSRPHMAEVGRVPNTEHFRNVQRFSVQTQPSIIALRIDESLFFANTHSVESKVNELCNEKPTVKYFILVLSAVNSIDSSAVDMLMDLDVNLQQRNIILYFSEIKGPVMDKLQGSLLLNKMQGRVFRSTHDAFVFCEQKENSVDYVI
jgi:SulP family sulfate permease